MHRRDYIVINLGYTANVPYFLTYGLISRGIQSVNLIPITIVNSYYGKIYYGSIFNNNPLNVPIFLVKSTTRFVFYRNVSRIIKFLLKRVLKVIIHIHSYNRYNDISFMYLLKKIGLNRVKIVWHFHGSDLRSISFDKVRFIDKISAAIIVSTPDLLIQCKRFNLQCDIIPNIYDPLIDKIIQRFPVSSDNDIRIFIPTRFDYSKGLNVFFDYLLKVIEDLYDKRIAITLVMWPRTRRLLYPYLNKLGKYNNVSLRIIPLLPRIDLFKYMMDHDLIIGQFKLGSLGMTEVEALALQKNVIMGPLEKITLKFYNDALPVIVIQSSNDLRILLRKKPKPNIEGRKFVKKHHSMNIVIEKLIKLYSEIL